MRNGLLVVFERCLRWPDVRPDTTVVPSFLLVLDLLQDAIIQLDNIRVLLTSASGPLDSLANAYLLSELICGTIDANDEVPTTDLMLT